ncbi:MAG: ABC transporter permease [Spirosomataceae bacterium]
MLKNYLTVTIRNLLRNKGFAIINTLGLAVSIACCLLIALVVQFETGFDKHHARFDRIYHVVTDEVYADGAMHSSGVPIPAGEAIRVDFPQLEKVARIHAQFGSQITVLKNGQPTDKKFIEDAALFFVEPAFFQIFDFPLVTGKVQEDPNTVVLTKKWASKYFGDWKNAQGQFLKLDNDLTLKVTGVMEDIPVSTDFPVQIAISYKTFSAREGHYGYNTHWGSNSSNDHVYILLPPNLSSESMSRLFPAFCQKHYEKDSNSKKSHQLIALAENHYDETYGSLMGGAFKKSTIWTLLLIGVLILVMACINFINLATAQAVRRSKEVGIRKVVGSSWAQLVRQFMGETLLIVLVSVGVAVLLAELALPFMNLLTNLPEATPFLAQPLMWALLGAITLSVTFLSGFYPALVLSGFEPVKALKSRITFQTVGGLSLRRSLVVLQFVISQLLVIGTVVAIMQMNFVQNIDLGLNKEAVLVTNLPPNDSLNLARYEGLKNQLAQLSTVKSVSFCSDAPSSDNNWDTNFAFDHRKDEEFNSSLKFADADYFKTFGLRLVAGRSFVQSDTSREVVINETMLHKLGYQKPELILGKEFKLGGRGQWKPIVGVVKDFKANSIREAIKPISIHARKRFYNNIAIKIEPTQIDQTEAQIKAIWEKTYPDYVYQSRFFDEQIANFYRQEDRLSLLFRIFAGIAIFIGCLGLYGLVSYMAVQRTKEIGIRKVLGASVGNVVWNFSKEFLLLVGTAFVIAAPIGYYVMSRWLENFVFKIDMGVGVYLIAGGLSLVVALLTMGYKAFQAATLNPVKSLKTE